MRLMSHKAEQSITTRKQQLKKKKTRENKI